ncbi:DUF6362 family protein [Roseibium salinum]|uniref:DUF6362 family protein n=1 Tax=Roseibium salinum TaxID=1604349 RepID=A0ABT3QXX6_9HYPH|nr:DUF6362 family protein [Roseibium sp. DSM 29163]MCX2721769.1 DUF6362 family protein [Roseibium sp. DSM 29163]MDN3720185.1 DUF6362 family protein [Roseibium salinum]
MIPDTPEDIMNSLVEAVEVIAVTGKGDGPRAILTAWPEYRRQLARRRRVFQPAEISRAEEAITWFSLIEDADARRALQFEVMCKAGGGRFSRVCEKYGWKRSTVTSRNRAVLRRLAERVSNADG